MRGSDLAEVMASAVDRIVSAREGTGALDKSIEVVIVVRNIKNPLVRYINRVKNTEMDI